MLKQIVAVPVKSFRFTKTWLSLSYTTKHCSCLSKKYFYYGMPGQHFFLTLFFLPNSINGIINSVFLHYSHLQYDFWRDVHWIMRPQNESGRQKVNSKKWECSALTRNVKMKYCFNRLIWTQTSKKVHNLASRLSQNILKKNLFHK